MEEREPFADPGAQHNVGVAPGAATKCQVLREPLNPNLEILALPFAKLSAWRARLPWERGRETPNAAGLLTHGAHGAFGVRRLVAAFNSLVLPHTGSKLPGLPRCACSQAWVFPENGGGCRTWKGR